MTTPNPHDSASRAALDRLVDAVGRGDLDLAEFDRRSLVVARAESQEEIAAAVDGLPGPSVQPAARPRPAPRRDHAGEWHKWAAVGVINVAIWAAVAIAVGPVHFWPVWVVVPWGIVLVLRRGRPDLSRCGRVTSQALQGHRRRPALR